MNPVDRFAANLKRARADAGFSQEELAVRASLHRTEIGLLERGERMPRIDTAIKLASALGVHVADLLAGIEWTPGNVRAGEFLGLGREGGNGGEEARRGRG